MAHKHLTMEDFYEAIHNSKKHTPEEKAKAEELGRKMKETSYEEHRETRKKMDEERGYVG